MCNDTENLGLFVSATKQQILTNTTSGTVFAFLERDIHFPLKNTYLSLKRCTLKNVKSILRQVVNRSGHHHEDATNITEIWERQV